MSLPKDHNDEKPFPVLSPLIPKGDYCYTRTGRTVIDDRVWDHDEYRSVSYYFRPETKVCPFWKSAGKEAAYCAYMGVSSDRETCDNLIWDQVKECGLNPDDTIHTLFELEEMRETQTETMKAEARIKRLPRFMESVINILLDSETNELTYDGVTYTLSQHIYDNLNGLSNDPSFFQSTNP